MDHVDIPMDRVMWSNTHGMHVGKPETGTKVAQIVTETIIEGDKSESSMFFSAPFAASSNTLVFESNTIKKPSGSDEQNENANGISQKPSGGNEKSLNCQCTLQGETEEA